MADGVFCIKSGKVARLEGGVCTGETLVKGDGVLPQADEYGVPYVRECSHSRGSDGMVVSRAPGRVVIVSCIPVVNPDEVLTVLG